MIRKAIHQWMYDAYKAAYQRLGKYPGTADDEEIMRAVMDRISEADIWIPYGEIAKHYRSIRSNLRKGIKVVTKVQGRPDRAIMPRPAVLNMKTKYDRGREKRQARKEIDEQY